MTARHATPVAAPDTSAARPHPAVRSTASLGSAGGTSSPWIVAVFGIPLLVLFAVLCCPFPPLQDFLEWIYQGKVVAALLSGAPADGVRFADYPVPNSATQVALGLLTLALPASVAAQVFLVAYVAAAVAVAWKISSRYQPAIAGPLCVVLLTTVFFNAPFWNGYTNYQIGLVLFCAWLALDEDRRMAAGTLAAFGLAAFLVHLTAFVCLATLAGLEALRSRRIRPALLGFAPSAGLALWYAASMTRARFAPGAPPVDAQPDGASGLVLFAAYKAYTFLKAGPYHNFVFSSGGDAAVRPIAYWAGVGVNAAFAALLLAAFAGGAWTLWRVRSTRAAPMLVAASLFALVFLALPAGRWVGNTGERFLYPALLLLLLCLPLRRTMVTALATLSLYFAVGLGGLASSRAEWLVPVDPDWTSLQRVLFLHRPTTFVSRFEEVRRMEALGGAPRLPLAFETSVLLQVPAAPSAPAHGAIAP